MEELNYTNIMDLRFPEEKKAAIVKTSAISDEEEKDSDKLILELCAFGGLIFLLERIFN